MSKYIPTPDNDLANKVEAARIALSRWPGLMVSEKTMGRVLRDLEYVRDSLVRAGCSRCGCALSPPHWCGPCADIVRKEDGG